MHIGSLPGYLRGIEKSIPLSVWKPGDCVIHNHPYYGASHSPDIAVVMPVFFENELVGFSANTAHHVDIGAATPGLIIDVPDMFAEGMLFNGIKLYEAGNRSESLWRYIRDNTRVPGLVMGDLEAQIASAELGVRRFQELLGTYGKETVLQATRQLMDYTEAMLRREIAKIPDGDYIAEGFLDDDGRNRGKHLPVKVTVKKRGDGIEVDLTGSCAAGADGIQRSLRGLDQSRVLFCVPCAVARYLYSRRAHPAERGLVPAGEGHGAVGLDLQSDRARSRRKHASARSNASSTSSSRRCHLCCQISAPPGTRPRFPSRLSPASAPTATTGCSWR